MGKVAQAAESTDIEHCLGALTRSFQEPVLGHFFDTVANSYFYDACTGQIVKLDRTSRCILQTLGTHRLSRTISHLVRREGEQPVIQAAGEILRFRVERDPPLFLSSGPQEVIFTYDSSQVRNMLLTQLEGMALSITSMCNLDCRYCTYSGIYSYRTKKSTRVMSVETMERCVDYFVKHSLCDGLPALGFYGGEPLLAFALIKKAVDLLLSRAPNRRFLLNMTTNLTVLPSTVLAFLKNHDFDLAVSLDGPEPVHDRYRVTDAGEGTHKKVLGNLARIKDYDEKYYDQRIRLICTLAPPYRLLEVCEFFAKFNLLPKQGVMFSFVEPPDHPFCDPSIDLNSFPPDLELLQQEYVALSRERRYGVSRYRVLMALLGPRFHRVYCRRVPSRRISSFSPGGICIPGKRKIYVRWDGTFFPCERVREYDSLVIGNSHDGVDVEKVFRLCQDFFRSTANECKQCWAFLLCDLCFQGTAGPNGIEPEKKKLLCERVRKTMSHWLTTMSRLLEEDPETLRHLDVSISESVK